MYRLYMEHCKQTNVAPEKSYLYLKIFDKEFNLHRPSKKPQNDTRAKCDKYRMIIQSSKSDEARLEAEQEKSRHQKMAEKAYSQKREDKQKAKENDKLRYLLIYKHVCLLQFW